jgi:hypothetical protein
MPLWIYKRRNEKEEGKNVLLHRGGEESRSVLCGGIPPGLPGNVISDSSNAYLFR